ncbi:venom toxin OcyC11-like isoform X1 [Eriocheir sinensis]|uniref:venom toxin OcyC11-like isoform X1 n=1 Tax=Eriocheir sinensis TaxID=95602 RepID=UPI0021C567B0|nr:venom toxin OcyC11-like isoform X1 [Eriocheir sinensis]
MGMLRAVLLTGSVLVLLVLLTAPHQAEAGLGREIVNDPDHPNTCLIREDGIRVEEGHTWQLPHCTWATCTKDSSESMVILYATCGLIGVEPGCRLIRDMTQPYPRCCGKVVCGARSGSRRP